MNNIQDKVMLVNLSVSQWTARKLDKGASNATADMYNAAHEHVRTTKSTIAKKHLQDIIKIVGEIRTYHYKHTLPFDNNGAALLTTAIFPEYMAEIGKFKNKFESAVNKLIDNYDDYINEQKTELGSLFNQSDYPSTSELRHKYKVSAEFAPMPVGDNFRVSLDAETLAEIKADIETKAQSCIDAAMSDLFKRAYDAIAALKERMTDDNGKPKTFRDTLIGNISELADILPKLNVTNDPDLSDLADTLKSDLSKLIPNELRQDKTKRRDVIKKADAILNKLNKRGGDTQNIQETIQAPDVPVEVIETEPIKNDTDMTAKMASLGII